MPAPGWLTRSRAEVPAGDGWLSERERAVQDGLLLARRRDDWRLGRWTAKQAVALACAVDAARVEVVAAADGAPEAYLDGAPLGRSLSISHRAGRALAVVGDGAVGCDLEWVEPRSAGFAEDWLAPAEREWAAGDPLRVNLAWTAKEAAAKVRREGLRLDVRMARSSFALGGDGPWRAASVAWPDAVTEGWWAAAGGFVACVAAAPAAGPPVALEPCGKPTAGVHRTPNPPAPPPA